MNSIAPMNLNDQITISMASIPERMDGMLRVLETLLPYCDNFDVCLNGYDAGMTHPLFDDPKVFVSMIDPKGDLGARGKFYMAHRTPGYHITVDDDLVYPVDYVATLLRGVEKYKRKAVVGFHGQFIVQGTGALILLKHQDALSQDIPVHMLGTGTMAYHTDAFNEDMRSLVPGKVDDQVASLAMEFGLPMIALKHDAQWLVEDEAMALRRPLRRNTELLEAARKRMANRNWTFKPMPE